MPVEDVPIRSAAELRLRRHADFQRVYAAVKKQHGKQMSFFAATRAVVDGEYAGPRVGLTVGKVMGKAHVRNRIKRRLREAVRAEQAALLGLAIDVVLHPRKTVETIPFAELRAEVAGVFRRVSKTAGQRGGESAKRGTETAGHTPGGTQARDSVHEACGPTAAGSHFSREERGEGGAQTVGAADGPRG